MTTSCVLLGMRRELLKLAAAEVVPEEPPVEEKPTHPLITAGKRLGAYGLGVGAGFGGYQAIKKLVEGRTGRPLFTHPIAAEAVGLGIPLLTGLAPLSFQIAQDSAFKRIQADRARRAKYGR